MGDQGPFRVAMATLRHTPALWLLALAWDLARWGLALALTPAGLAWIRWEFHLGWQTALPREGWFTRLLLPPAMPGSEQLGVSYGAQPPVTPDWNWFHWSTTLVVAVMFILEPLVRAGYLHLANGALHGVRPSLRSFWRGIGRYGARFFLLACLWLPIGLWLSNGDHGLPHVVLLGLETVLTACFYVAQFVIITDDAHLLQALPGALPLAWLCLPALIGPALLSAVVSGLLTAGLSAVHGLHPLVVGPLWSVAGTALTLYLLAAWQDGINTRSEPRMSWSCRQCGVQNSTEAMGCCVCDQPRNSVQHG